MNNVLPSLGQAPGAAAIGSLPGDGSKPMLGSPQWTPKTLREFYDLICHASLQPFTARN
jgi:hypothetical protein